jgi:hypothetical protein
MFSMLIRIVIAALIGFLPAFLVGAMPVARHQSKGIIKAIEGNDVKSLAGYLFEIKGEIPPDDFDGSKPTALRRIRIRAEPPEYDYFSLLQWALMIRADAGVIALLADNDLAHLNWAAQCGIAAAHLACEGGQEEIVRVLKERGAFFDGHAGNGPTAREICKQNGIDIDGL